MLVNDAITPEVNPSLNLAKISLYLLFALLNPSSIPSMISLKKTSIESVLHLLIRYLTANHTSNKIKPSACFKAIFPPRLAAALAVSTINLLLV